MLRILLTDDHILFRKGIKRLLEDNPQVIMLVEEASNAHELFAKLSISTFDLVVLDISMPDRSGLDILKQLKVEYPAMPVLILSMHPEDIYAVRMIKAGASGYITKSSAPDQLLTAIQKVANRNKYISESLAEKLAMFVSIDCTTALHEKLSDREFEVMRQISMGKRVNEIADNLFLSKKTVSTYRSRVLQKLNLANNAEIMKYALNNELV